MTILYPNKVFAINLVHVHQNFMYVVHRVVAIVGCRVGPSLGVLVFYFLAILALGPLFGKKLPVWQNIFKNQLISGNLRSIHGTNHGYT